MSLMGAAPKREHLCNPSVHIIVRGSWLLRYRLYTICVYCGFKERVR